MTGKLEAILALVGLAYLGFWSYGLVMSVFEIDQLIGFTVVAAVIIVLLAASAIRMRRAARQGEAPVDEELERASRHQREVRGY